MATVFDYLKWRGDLSFSDVRVNEVDSIIFAMLTYIDFGELCGADELLLRESAVDYCSDGKYDSVNLGLIMPSKQINKMFCDAATSRRFGGVRVTDFVEETSDEDGYQFSAVTFHLSGKQMVLAFRGTDDSIVGWREDFCLSFLDEIPAQRMAVEYLERMAAKYPDERIYLTGHSKGGNLAVYSAVKCSELIASRIVRAYCNDGPGLTAETVGSHNFKKRQRKLTVLIPQSSYIGIMFEKGEKYKVVKCRGVGVFQHDPYYWELEGPEYVKLPELSKWGKQNEQKFRVGMAKMTADEKREFVETFFSLVEATGARTLSEFADGGLRRIVSIIKGYGGLDKQKREMMLAIILRLLDIKKHKG